MHSRRRPTIGVTLSRAEASKELRWPTASAFDYLGKAYHYAVEQSGGLPVGIFNSVDPEAASRYVGQVDGVVFSGGPDMHPKYYNQKPHPSVSRPVEQRDSFEIALLRQAVSAQIPILCICRGHQLLNVLMGGTLHQDLSLVGDEVLRHAYPDFTRDAQHKVKLGRDTMLYDLIGKSEIMCNSSHHQCVAEVGQGLRASAWASDGIIEGLELDHYPFLVSVQWHPERIYRRGHAKRLFEALVDACG